MCKVCRCNRWDRSEFPCRGKFGRKGEIVYVKTKIEALEACGGLGQNRWKTARCVARIIKSSDAREVSDNTSAERGFLKNNRSTHGLSDTRNPGARSIAVGVVSQISGRSGWVEEVEALLEALHVFTKDKTSVKNSRSVHCRLFTE
jgi:hypothetical protein